MFGKKKPDPTNREMLTDRLYAEAKATNTGSDEFNEAVAAIIKLEDTKASEKKRWMPSPDAVVTAVASLSGIVLILYAELWKDRIVTSKSMGFVQKPH